LKKNSKIKGEADGLPPSPGAQTNDAETRQSAASQYRHWVRTNSVCNQRCMFCLDSDSHDGSFEPVDAVKAEIKKGWNGAGGRLVLSGGEASIHPHFIDFVKYGREIGFTHIQTITNGRMFAYEKFADAAVEAGLNEITFSIHGHNPRLHDKLVGVSGAFAQALKGLQNALKAGVIVNVDVCINGLNYMYLDEILDFFEALGVHEFDLLYVTPFGRAWDNRGEMLFDINEAFPYLNKALRKRSDGRSFVWTNRFPPQFLEGMEELIQDPHKLHDEVRGRRFQFDDYMRKGERLGCFGDRCERCFIEAFCASFFDFFGRLKTGNAEFVAVDIKGSHNAGEFDAEEPTLEFAAGKLSFAAERFKRMKALSVAARTIDDAANLFALAKADGFEKELSLSLDLDAAPGVKALAGFSSSYKRFKIDEIAFSDAESGEDLLKSGFDGRLIIKLDKKNCAFALKKASSLADALKTGSVRFAYEPKAMQTEVARLDADYRRFFAALTKLIGAPPYASGLPQCFGARHDDLAFPRGGALWLDLLSEDNVVRMHRFVEWYIRRGYLVKSTRCAQCPQDDSCRGMNVNFIRRFGFSSLTPIMPQKPD